MRLQTQPSCDVTYRDAPKTSGPEPAARLAMGEGHRLTAVGPRGSGTSPTSVGHATKTARAAVTTGQGRFCHRPRRRATPPRFQ
jgi:hypothetical protein